MKPAAMHEHRGDDRHRVGTRFAGKSYGNERPVLDELVASVEFDKKDYNVQRNQRIGDDGKRTALRVVVTNRKHPWTASLQRGPVDAQKFGEAWRVVLFLVREA